MDSEYARLKVCNSSSNFAIWLRVTFQHCVGSLLTMLVEALPTVRINTYVVSTVSMVSNPYPQSYLKTKSV